MGYKCRTNGYKEQEGECAWCHGGCEESSASPAGYARNIDEAIGLIEQAINENTKTVEVPAGHDCEVVCACEICGRVTDKDIAGHKEGCFVEWLEDALKLLSDVESA